MAGTQTPFDDAPAASVRPEPTTVPFVYFVTGLHRSGTTILSDAVAEAIPAATLTVADLAAYNPLLAELMTKMQTGRAVDQKGRAREIRPSTSVEYGWYLFSTARRLAYEHAHYEKLRDLVIAVAGRSGLDRVVLKNPLDIGRVDKLLLDFPNAVAIIIRRNLVDVESSLGAFVGGDAPPGAQALDDDALYESGEYLDALLEGDPLYRRVSPLLARPIPRRLFDLTIRWGSRFNVLLLVHRIKQLPLHRVAFISYDEMMANPREGARWAAHVLDPASFARSFSRVASPAAGSAGRAKGIVGVLDRRWETAWAKARERQVAAGLLAGDKRGRLPDE